MSKSINRFFKEWTAFLSGLVVFSLVLLINPLNLDEQANKTLAVAGLMITWWVNEALPMPVVAMLPILLFPFMGIAGIKGTSSSYGDSIIYLFLGGFMIVLAI